MPQHTAAKRAANKKKKSTVKSIVKAKKSQLAGIMASIRGGKAKKKTKSKKK